MQFLTKITLSYDTAGREQSSPVYINEQETGFAIKWLNYHLCGKGLTMSERFNPE